MLDIIILAISAFLAGVLNTLAGGGTFLTLPALIYTGVAPVTANATSAIAVLPGYAGGAFGFRKEITSYNRQGLLSTAGFTLVGGLAGALLLLLSSDKMFSIIVPFLLAIATLIFAFDEQIQQWTRNRRPGNQKGAVGILLVSAYGGYFNGGLGIVLLALFSLWGMRDLNMMNGLKSGLSFVLSAISAATFAIAGIVAWPQAFVMMGAATIGGYVGAPLARKIPQKIMRRIVIGIGSAMSILFFGKLL